MSTCFISIHLIAWKFIQFIRNSVLVRTCQRRKKEKKLLKKAVDSMLIPKRMKELGQRVENVFKFSVFRY